MSRWKLVAAVGVLATVPAAAGQFVDVTAVRGVDGTTMARGMTGGAAAVDLDDDGDVDLLVPTGADAPLRVYRNDGAGGFTDVAAELGLAAAGNHRAVLCLDVDGDARLDVIVAGDCFDQPACDTLSGLRLFLQRADGSFEDVTATSGLDTQLLLPNVSHLSGLTAGDLDGDGDLDLVASAWQGWTAVYENDGAGRFTDIGAESGITGATIATPWQSVVHDFDGDGLFDVYMAVDFAPNRLWRNLGGATFVDVAPAAGADNAMNDMGVTLGDYDNDGDLDVYVTNITQIDPPETILHNLLLRNGTTPGAIQFADVSFVSGVEQGWWGWGTTFLDADNDGYLDVAATNGFSLNGWEERPSKLYRNLGPVGGGDAPGDLYRFEDASAALGYDNTRYGAGLLAFDADRDGDLELFQVCGDGQPPLLLDNAARQRDPAATAWIVVRPRLAGGARPIGATVTVDAGGRRRTGVLTAGTSSLCQEPAEVHVGLGRVDVVDEIVVRWPAGIVPPTRRLAGVAANQVLDVTPRAPAANDGDGDVDDADLAIVLAGYATRGEPWTNGDGDGDGDVDLADLNAVLAAFTS